MRDIVSSSGEARSRRDATRSRSPAVFLDKDGTLLVNDPYNVDPARMRLAPGAEAALHTLGALNVPLIVISNQPGVALGRFTWRELADVESELRARFAANGARLTACYFCPHHPAGVVPGLRTTCACRKPRPGLLRFAQGVHGIDLGSSWMIGDILDDVEAAHRAGSRAVMIDNGNETEWRSDPVTPSLRRPDHTTADLAAAAEIVARALSAECALARQSA